MKGLSLDPQNRNLCAYICAQVVYIDHIPVFVLLHCEWVQDLAVPVRIGLNWWALCAHVCAALTRQLCCGSKVPSVTSHRHTFMKGNLSLCTTNKMTVLGFVEWCYTEVAYRLSVRITEFKYPATKAAKAGLTDRRHSCLKRVTRVSATQVTNGFLQPVSTNLRLAYLCCNRTCVYHCSCIPTLNLCYCLLSL
jgi:hypothetical protein